jgi:hypothetical protein
VCGRYRITHQTNRLLAVINLLKARHLRCVPSTFLIKTISFYKWRYVKGAGYFSNLKTYCMVFVSVVHPNIENKQNMFITPIVV